MGDRTFRFGVVDGASRTGEQLARTARRVEELGYSTLLIPDTTNTLAVFPAMTAAAMATTTLRIGSFVLNTAVRNPRAVAWEAATVDALSGGRIELGLGTGRSAVDAERLGVPDSTPAERLAHLAESLRVIKDLMAVSEPVGPGAPETAGWGFPPPTQRPHPPILQSGWGPKVLALAAAEADIITFGCPPRTTELALGERVAMVRDAAGDRYADLELSLNLLAVGDELPEWVTRFMGVDLVELARVGSVLVLNGTPEQMADRLLRRREELGISYVTLNGRFVDQFAPAVERLADR